MAHPTLRLTSISVIMALVFSVLMVTPAFADDGVPPADPAVPTEEAGDGSDPADAVEPTAEPAPTEVTEPIAEPVPAEVVPIEPADAPADGTVAEVLGGLPDGTTIVVVGQEGEALPLATEEAAEILAEADPIWCPVSVSTPLDGLSGCSPSQANLLDLFNWLKAHEPAMDGVIWVEAGLDSSALALELDGASEITMAPYKLTIKGGWNGLGTKTIDTTDPSEINVHLWITNWGNDITISDVVVTGVAVGPALHVTTTGKITLTRVKVESNTSTGAYLDNTPATTAPADVLVTLSQFVENTGGSGLDIYSDGTITLAGVIANGNHTFGARLDNDSAATAKNVVMTAGPYEFSDNGSTGLLVYTKGAITLKDVTAVGNGNLGAQLHNIAGTAAGVTLTGVNVFSENSATGLGVASNGAISLNSLVANANFGYAAYLDNTGAVTAQPVKLTGSNQFKFNQYGLMIDSNGPISLSNVTASHSLAGVGAQLNNAYGTYSSSVTLTGVNVFNENYSTGLAISSYGGVSASSVTANWNGLGGLDGYGVYVGNNGAASAKPVTFGGTNQFNGNYWGGLYVASKGAVTLSKVSANDNVHGGGAAVANTYALASAPQNVTLTGANTFSGNYSAGLYVESYGVISIANLTASDNGLAGSYPGADLINTGGTLAKAVTLSGTNIFQGNTGLGLDVYSYGVITVSNLLASGNSTQGAYLYNAYSSLTSAVAVNGTSEFADNGTDGLVVASRGNITLQNFDSYGNEGEGVRLSNEYIDATGNVTVGTSKSGWCNGLWDNDYSGIVVQSLGSITVSNLCAWSNGDSGTSGDGAYLWNQNAVTAKGVTLKGTNSFDDNYGGGLWVYSKGPIVASSLSASGNTDGYGVSLSNQASGAAGPQNVTVSGYSYFSENYYDGLLVSTFGTITASNLTAVDNGLSGWGYGAQLNNYQYGSAELPRNVTLTGYNTFSGNDTAGLWVDSLGSIAASNVWAEGSLNGEGATLTNSHTGGGATPVVATGGVTLSGTSNVFSYNDTYGLWVQSYGPISVAGLWAEDNGSYGARLFNSGAATPKPVTLSGKANSFLSNPGRGLDIVTKGVITIANLEASYNGETGAFLVNSASTAAAPQKVTLSGTSRFYENWFSGLYVDSYGAITLSNVTASWNGQSGSSGDGVYLDNHQLDATTASPVTLSGYGSFHENYMTGLFVASLGAIKANSLTASWNGDDGVYLDNQWYLSANGVTLTGTSKFEENDSDGLVIFSNGAITLSNITANWNLEDGAYLKTIGLLAPQKVTLTGTNTFDDNGDFGAHTGNGLEVVTDGQITISNLTANWNADDGAYLDNWSEYWTGTPGLTLSGVNTFLGNYNTGLSFEIGWGAVSLGKVTADDNGLSGVDGGTYGNITITCGSMTSNGGYGWNLWTPSVVTLKGVFAYGNWANTFLAGGGTLVVYRACS